MSNDILYHVPHDDRYARLSVHDLKVTRANMIASSKYTKYELALVQFWIMKKEGRLPKELMK